MSETNSNFFYPGKNKARKQRENKAMKKVMRARRLIEEIEENRRIKSLYELD